MEVSKIFFDQSYIYLWSRVLFAVKLLPGELAVLLNGTFLFVQEALAVLYEPLKNFLTIFFLFFFFVCVYFCRLYYVVTA